MAPWPRCGSSSEAAAYGLPGVDGHNGPPILSRHGVFVNQYLRSCAQHCCAVPPADAFTPCCLTSACARRAPTTCLRSRQQACRGGCQQRSRQPESSTCRCPLFGTEMARELERSLATPPPKKQRKAPERKQWEPAPAVPVLRTVKAVLHCPCPASHQDGSCPSPSARHRHPRPRAGAAGPPPAIGVECCSRP